MPFFSTPYPPLLLVRNMFWFDRQAPIDFKLLLARAVFHEANVMRAVATLRS